MLYILYALAMVVVYAAKMRYHSQWKTQWTMLDYCYTINVLVIHWALFDVDPSIAAAITASATGPVLGGALIYDMKLSLRYPVHTSNWVFHVLPGIVCSILMTPAARETPYATSLGLAMLWYFIWQVCYAVGVYIIFGSFFSDPEQMTSQRFWYYSDQDPIAELVFSQLRKIGVYGPKEAPDDTTWKARFTFFGLQIVFTLLTLQLGLFCAKFGWGHAAVLVATVGLTAYKGYHAEPYNPIPPPPPHLNDKSPRKKWCY